MTDNLLIRADASPQIGTGHVMRCVALAQAWRERGGSVVFLQATSTPSVVEFLQREGFEARSFEAEAGSPADATATATAACAHELETPLVIADGYRFSAEYQKALKTAGLRVLLLDDYGHAVHYYADLVLNQSLGADPQLYAQREPNTSLLLGTRYTLLRREFGSHRNRVREFPANARKVLVTLGGSDPDNATAKVVEALQLLSEIEAVVVVGGSNPNRKEIESLIARNDDPGTEIRLVANVQNMAELMEWADVAVVAGGSTVWELACLGLPGLILVLADNQNHNAAVLDRQGVCRNLGKHRDVDARQIATALGSLLSNRAERETMSRLGRALVDGCGAARVIDRLREPPVIVRPVQPEDCRRFWEWANDPVVRAVSFHSEPIPWETHQRWFANKLSDPMTRLWIGVDALNLPFGQVRFDIREGGHAEISISVDAAHRQAGFGTALIRQSVTALFATTGVAVVEARIKTDNRGSIRAFEKAGFGSARPTTVAGSEAVMLSLPRDS